MRLPSSLQGRLMALVLGMVAVIWAVAVMATWIDVRHELDELLDSHLAQAAALLVVQQASEFDDDQALDAPQLHRYATKVAFQVFHEGQLSLRSANAPTQPMVDAGQRFTSGFRTVRMDGTSWRVFAAQGAKRDVQVYVGEQEKSRTDILWAVMRSTLWPVMVALPLLAMAVAWAVVRGTAPLRELGRTLAGREPHALSPVAVANAPSEMTPMLDALNGLLGRISQLMASERRFTADAAHELRTPIAAIRAQAQVALAERNDTLRQHALQSTLDGCDRATRLVEQLLTLSRLESGAAPQRQPVALGEHLQQVLAQCAPQALGKGQVLELDVGEPCTVPGDATLLGVLARNLVDNAIRYSPAHARIQVSLARQGARVLLTVQDSGPGLTDAQAARLGERFFRVLGTGEAGSGLGWSIVQRIAAAHGATVVTGRSALGGLSVTVALAQA
jgi:two-component system sensor histidine kinase QseC